VKTKRLANLYLVVLQTILYTIEDTNLPFMKGDQLEKKLHRMLYLRNELYMLRSAYKKQWAFETRKCDHYWALNSSELNSWSNMCLQKPKHDCSFYETVNLMKLSRCTFLKVYKICFFYLNPMYIK